MLYFVVTAGFKDVVESNEVGFDIGIGIGDAVAYASLCSKVHNNLRLISGEDVFDEWFVGNVSLYEGKERVLLQLFQAVFLQAYIVVVVHVIYSDNSVIGVGLAVFLHKVGAYKSCGSSY